MRTSLVARVLVLVFFGFGLLANASHAQSTNAAVGGQITDEQGRVVPGVTVVLTNLNTGVGYSAKTNGDGFYSAPALPPGIYRANVTKDGFKNIVKGDIELHVQDVASINFQLQLGSVNETVTVESGGLVINTTDGSVGTVIDRDFVSQLPLNGRSFNTLIVLTPGVVIAPAGDAAPGQFSVNGQRTNANYITVDGVSVNFGVNAGITGGQQGAGGTAAFSGFGGTSSLVSVDAVQEFRVQTSSFAPEYGRTPGGQVSIETRSGTNAFHGGIFDYFRNDKLDANNWFNNAVPPSKGGPLPRSEERQNDFGGFLGGPIYRNKTFFFFSYEGLRLRQPQTKVARVPSEYARTSAVAAAAPYLDAYPQPDDRTITPGVYLAPFTASFSNQVTMNATSLRVDHSFNSRWLLFGRYNDAPSHSLTRPASPNGIANTKAPTKTTTLGLTTFLTSRLTNSVRANYSVQHGDQFLSLDSIGGAVPPDSSLLLPAPLSPRNGAGLFQGQAGFFQFGTIPDVHESQVSLVDDIAFSSGAHQMKFGVDWRRLNFALGSLPGFLAYFSFSTKDFAKTGAADFLFDSNELAAKMLLHNLSFYGQDAWSIGRRLTVTYGLRWELDPAPSGLDGTKLASWQNVNDPGAISLASFGTPVWKTTYGNFAPRVGIAYRITQRGDFVVRGGWGSFYDLGTGTVAGLASGFPNSANLFVPGPIQLPLASATPYIPAISLNPSSTSVVSGFSPNLNLPRSYQWNVAVEKSLWGRQAFSVTYVGQTGRELLRHEVLLPPDTNSTFSPGTSFVLTRNGDTSDYNALQVQYRRPLSRSVQALLNYTWSHSIDTGSDDSVSLNSHFVIPGASDRGSSSFDVRHNFTGAVTYDLPRLSKELILSALTRNWSLDGVVQVRTGFPFDVTTSTVAIPGISQPTRADLVPGQPIWLSGPYPGGKKVNFDAFSIPTQPRQGTLGRNAITGFGMSQVDLSVARKFNFTERVSMQFRSDFFNVFNHPNFANPVTCLDCGLSGFGGTATQMLNSGLSSGLGLGLNSLYQTGGPRSIQLSMKIQF